MIGPSLYENVIVKKNEAENLLKKIGITFSVYNNFDSTTLNSI